MKYLPAICTLVAALFFSAVSPCAAANSSIQVIDTGRSGDFRYAIVRDSAMRGHNNYCITIGAHVGALLVKDIRDDGVVLSDGEFLPNVHYAIARTNFD
jgi:hypothetical protein